MAKDYPEALNFTNDTTTFSQKPNQYDRLNLTFGRVQLTKEAYNQFKPAFEKNTTLKSLSIDGWRAEEEKNYKILCELLGMIAQNTSLNSLSLCQVASHTQENVAKKLTNIISTNKSIKELSLTNFLNTHDKGFFKIIADALAENTNITSLDLSSVHGISDADIKLILSTFLRQSKTLESLKLNNSKIDDDRLKIIMDALKENVSLKELIIDSNSITSAGARDITETLLVNKTLAHLSISNNSIDNEGAKEIADTLKVSQSLKSINLRQNCIGNEGAKEIAGALKVNQSLKSINLAWNKIDDEGVKEIAEALKNYTGLGELYIERNKTTGEGNTALLNIINTNHGILKITLAEGTTITVTRDLESFLATPDEYNYLNLDDDSSLTSENLIKLLKSLHDNETLIFLKLGYNKQAINEDSMAALGEFLQTNQSLTFLDLSGNAIGDYGKSSKFLDPLLEGLKQNTSLVHLDLARNSISDDSHAESIFESLKSTAVTELILDGNDILRENSLPLLQGVIIDASNLIEISLENTCATEGTKDCINGILSRHKEALAVASRDDSSDDDQQEAKYDSYHKSLEIETMGDKKEGGDENYDDW